MAQPAPHTCSKARPHRRAFFIAITQLLGYNACDIEGIDAAQAGSEGAEPQKGVTRTGRIPVAAAVKTTDGVIHFMPSPHRHHHTLHALNRAANPGGVKTSIVRGEQGFVMSDGTFADRIEAAEFALAAGMIKELSHPPYLYSEDLW